jgi:hypothetical protein
MKRGWILLVLVVIMVFSGGASAALTTIGTANYGGNDYNLIYEGELGGSGLVWLDYTRAPDTWQNQLNWASGVGSSLTVTLTPGYSTNIDWTTGWRLPDSYDGNWGYNQTTPEMGHLYYVSLGKPAEGPLGDTSPFEDLQAALYRYSTEYSPNPDYAAWLFNFGDGGQSPDAKYAYYPALAVHPGEVSFTPVPEPATLILFEEFEDSSGFTVGGGYAHFWGVAPLSGTQDIPSNFVQGGSQSGAIFYGSFAKEYQGSPAATMTISLPDLTGYTNLHLVVALAAPDGIWEPTHRDSLHIIGGTAFSPVPEVACTAAGCVPVSGAIDSYLPSTYPDSLRSKVHSVGLDHQFQDFEYTIDSSLTSLTFAFASTDYPEIIGIDSVRITGYPALLGDFAPADCDVDGSDLAALIANTSFFDLKTFAQNFGENDCP